jgi:hypothetical protein
MIPLRFAWRVFARTGRLVLVACLGASSLFVQTVHARELEPGTPRAFFGLLRVRDLTPFGFRRLDMRPSQAAFAPAECGEYRVRPGYQNTWSMSENVDQYLRRRTQRGPMTQADAAAIRAMGGEAYLVDLELALIDIAFNYKVTENVGMYAVLSAAAFTGGFLDGFIEGFHDAFGIGSASRPYVDRNQINVLLNLKGQQVTQLDRSSSSGVLDPVFGVRYTFSRDPGFGNLVLDAAIKVPVSRAGQFSTNRFDVGVQLTAQALTGRSAWYAAGSAVYFSGSGEPLQSPPMLVPTAILGYEYRWREHTNFIVQAYASRSVFTAEQTQLSEPARQQVPAFVRPAPPPRERLLVLCDHREHPQLQQHARHRVSVRARPLVQLSLIARTGVSPRLARTGPRVKEGGVSRHTTLTSLRQERTGQPGFRTDPAGVRPATSIESLSPAGSSEVITPVGRLATVAWSTLPTNFQPMGILTNTKPVGGSTKTAKSWTLTMVGSAASAAVWAATGSASTAAAIVASICFLMVLSPWVSTSELRSAIRWSEHRIAPVAGLRWKRVVALMLEPAREPAEQLLCSLELAADAARNVFDPPAQDAVQQIGVAMQLEHEGPAVRIRVDGFQRSIHGGSDMLGG